MKDKEYTLMDWDQLTRVIVGTPLQIKWANEIRTRFTVALEDALYRMECLLDEKDQDIDVMYRHDIILEAQRNADATFWIRNEHSSLEQLLMDQERQEYQQRLQGIRLADSSSKYGR